MLTEKKKKRIIRRCCVEYLVFEVEGLHIIVFKDFEVYDFRIWIFSKSQSNIQSNRRFDLPSIVELGKSEPWLFSFFFYDKFFG